MRMDIFAFERKGSMLQQAIEAQRVEACIGWIEEIRSVAALVTRHGDLIVQRGAVHCSPADGAHAALAVDRSSSERKLARQLDDRWLVGFGLDRLFNGEIQRSAVHDVTLIRQLARFADIHAADAAEAELRPRGFYGNDRDVPVDQRPARDVPPGVVMVEIEATQRDEDLSKAD